MKEGYRQRNATSICNIAIILPKWQMPTAVTVCREGHLSSYRSQTLEVCIRNKYKTGRHKNCFLRLLKNAGNVLLAVCGTTGDVRAHFVALTNPEHACLRACMMATRWRMRPRDLLGLLGERRLSTNLLTAKNHVKRTTSRLVWRLSLFASKVHPVIEIMCCT